MNIEKRSVHTSPRREAQQQIAAMKKATIPASAQPVKKLDPSK